MALILESWLLELFAVLFTLSAGIYLYFSLCYQYWKRKGIPYLEPSFPFGNVSDVLLQRKSLSENFDSIYRQLEGHKLGGFYQLNRPTLMVRHPEMVKAVLVKDSAHFLNHGIHFDEESDPLSGGLFMMEGIKWKHMRQKTSPSFSSGQTRRMFHYFLECGEELKTYLAPFARRNDTIEVHDIAASYTTDVIATCAFGLQTNSLKDPDSEFRTMGRRIFEPTLRTALRNLMIFVAPKIGYLVNLPILTREVSNYFIGIVRATVDYRKRNAVKRNDFLQLLIDMKKNSAEENGTNTEPHHKQKNVYDVNGLTVEQIAAQVFVFFSAGFETSSGTISFCLYELALNQGIQDELRAEIDAAMMEHGGQLTYEAILGMEYMNRVVSETLRKYPTFPFLIRVCTKEYQLPGSEVKIDVGTGVLVPTHALHHDPQHYPNPEEFNPSRFTDEAKRTRHHYAYLPFGEGPRICIGSNFGLIQVKVGVASLISNFKVSVSEEMTAIPLVMEPAAFLMAPRGGIKLTISERR